MSRFLTPYEQYVAKTTDAPYEFGHAAGMVCLSTIALGRRWIDRGTGIRPNIYVMLTADSSRDRKSTSVDLAVDLLRDVEDERVGPSDFTAEGLIAYMRKRKPPGKTRSKIVIPISEFGRYLAAGKSYNAAASATLCDLYDGGDFTRTRSGKPPMTIHKPRVGMIAAVAYGMLERYADPLEWVTGFFARILWVMPDRRPPRYTSQPPKATRERSLALASLLDLRNLLKAKQGSMKIDPAAEAEHAKFSNSFVGTDADPVLAAQRERLLNAAWKLALLYQIDDDPAADIGQTAMIRAVSFAEHAWKGFQRIYARTAGTDFSKICQKLHARVWESMPAGINRRELYRSLHLKSEFFDKALDVLTKNGVVTAGLVGTNVVIKTSIQDL